MKLDDIKKFFKVCEKFDFLYYVLVNDSDILVLCWFKY
jgi:hypothetical protein